MLVVSKIRYQLGRINWKEEFQRQSRKHVSDHLLLYANNGGPLFLTPNDQFLLLSPIHTNNYNFELSRSLSLDILEHKFIL